MFSIKLEQWEISHPSLDWLLHLAKVDTTEVYKTAFEKRLKSEINAKSDFEKNVSSLKVDDISNDIKSLNDECNKKLYELSKSITTDDKEKNKEIEDMWISIKNEFTEKVNKLISTQTKKVDESIKAYTEYVDKYKSELDNINNKFNSDISNWLSLICEKLWVKWVIETQ